MGGRWLAPLSDRMEPIPGTSYHVIAAGESDLARAVRAASSALSEGPGQATPIGRIATVPFAERARGWQPALMRLADTGHALCRPVVLTVEGAEPEAALLAGLLGILALGGAAILWPDPRHAALAMEFTAAVSPLAAPGRVNLVQGPVDLPETRIAAHSVSRLADRALSPSSQVGVFDFASVEPERLIGELVRIAG